MGRDARMLVYKFIHTYIERERVTRTHTYIYIEENTRSTPHLCMRIYDVVSNDCIAYMILIWRQHGIDESIGYLSMITCSFILKNPGWKLKTWPTMFGSRCPHKTVLSDSAFRIWHCIWYLDHQHLVINRISGYSTISLIYICINTWKAIISALIVWSHLCESCYGSLPSLFNKMSKTYSFATGRFVWELLRFFAFFFLNRMSKWFCYG